MLFLRIVDFLDSEVDVHLYWRENLADHIVDHSSCNVVEFVIKIGSLKLFKPILMLTEIIHALLEHIILTLLHFFNGLNFEQYISHLLLIELFDHLLKFGLRLSLEGRQ